MVIGSGLLARAFASFKDDEKVLVFASGVSNSSTATEADYARERVLLLEQRGTHARLVYFSTCSLFDPALKDSEYIGHKRRMEDLVRKYFEDHLILRLPNVVGRTPNPHTLCNFFRDRILSGETFNVQTNACRYLIDVEEVRSAWSPILSDGSFRRSTINVCFDRPAPLPELVRVMEHLLGKMAKATPVDAGSCYEVNNSDFKRIWTSTGASWPDPGHWASTLAKYYGGRSATTG